MSTILLSLFWIRILGFWSYLASFAFEASIMYLVLMTLIESLFVHNQVLSRLGLHGSNLVRSEGHCSRQLNLYHQHTTQVCNFLSQMVDH